MCDVMNLKNIKESFANGEYDDLDFKREMIECPKLVKHILAMANTSGGIICFGVGENDDGKFCPVGLENIEDNTVIQEKLNKFLPHELEYNIIAINYSDDVEWNELRNKNFLLIIVEFTPEYIPFLPIKDSDIFTRVDIFCRKNSSSTKCEYNDLNDLLNKRIQTNVQNSLSEKDLEDLRLLFNYKLFNAFNPDFKNLYDLKFNIILKKIK